MPKWRTKEYQSLIDLDLYDENTSTEEIPKSDITSKTSVSSRKSLRKSKIVQILSEKLWLKFNLIHEILESITIYNKNNSYANTIIVSNEESQNTHQENFVKYNPKDTSLHLFADNLNDGQINIALTNMRNWKTVRQNAVLTLYPFNWCHPETNWIDIVAHNTGCMKLDLKKGRQIFKLTVLGNYYSVTFRSDSDIKIIDENELWRLLSTECLSMQKFVNDFSEDFYDIITSMGKKEYKENINKMYRSLLTLFTSDWTSSKFTRNYLWNAFLQELLKMLRRCEDPEGTQLMKILFMCPNFSIAPCCFEHHKNIAKDMCLIYNELKLKKCPCKGNTIAFDDFYINQIQDYAATLIKSHIKGMYVRKLKEYHDPKTKQYLDIQLKLKEFYEKYFEMNQEEIFNLIREFIGIYRILHVGYSDLFNAINMVEYNGIVSNVKATYTSFVCSIQLRCHSKHTDPYMIRFIISLKASTFNIIPTITILDNDNQTNVVYNSNCQIAYFKENQNGYSLYICIWSNDKHDSIDWKLQISSNKFVALLHACHLRNNNENILQKQPQQHQDRDKCEKIGIDDVFCYEYYGYYKKYYDEKMCQFNIFYEKNIPSSVIFTLSDPDIMVQMEVIDNNGEVIYKQMSIRGEIIKMGLKLDHHKGHGKIRMKFSSEKFLIKLNLLMMFIIQACYRVGTTRV